MIKVLKEVNTVTKLISRLDGTIHDSNSNVKFQWLRHMDVSVDYKHMTYNGHLHIYAAVCSCNWEKWSRHSFR